VRLPISPRPDRSSRKPAVERGVPVPAHSPTQRQPGSRVGFTSRRPGSSLRRSHLSVPLFLGVRAGESLSLNASQRRIKNPDLDDVRWSANAKVSHRDDFDCHRTHSPLVVGGQGVRALWPQIFKTYCAASVPSSEQAKLYFFRRNRQPDSRIHSVFVAPRKRGNLIPPTRKPAA
jgi:hypothetical protein